MNDDDFKFIPERYPGTRIPGISGFMRIRNESDFLPQVIESWLPCLDELVIAHNRCEDGSDIIIKYFERRSPKIKAVHYLPHVYPQGSSEYLKMPPDSIHSFVNYSNFALSLASREICVKIDGDDIAIPEKLDFACAEIRRKNIPPGEFWMFVGINLWRANGKIMVNGSNPFCGYDHGFFRAAPSVYFQKGQHCEYLGGGLRMKKTGFMYYHAKGLKNDRGVSNYDLSVDPASLFNDISSREIASANPITFAELMAAYPQAEELRYLTPPEKIVELPMP